MTKIISHLYIHIPFCNKICTYCDFTRFLKPKASVSVFESYLNDLKKELKEQEAKFNFKIKTIYIGGGTPNILDNDNLIKLFEMLKHFNSEEFTIELNPELINEEQLLIFKKYKINRLSMGVQTFNEKILKTLGREHVNSDVENAFKLANKIGFDNISIDMIYNLPFQNKEDIDKDISFILKLKPDHISWYSLILKEGSILNKKGYQLNKYNDVYFDNLINNHLKKMNYERYEVSSYCVNGKKGIHNLAYWKSCNWIGIGTSSVSCVGNTIIANSKKIDYSNSHSYTFLSKEDYYFQILMMGLRLIDGIKLEGKTLIAFNYFKNKIEPLIKSKKMIIENNFLKVIDINILNDILIEIL